MRRLIWIFAWAGVAVWSLFAFAAYGLIDIVGGIFARNADIFSSHPETVEWISWIFGSLRSLGTGTVMVVWALVSLTMLAVPWFLDRMVVPMQGAMSGSLPGGFSGMFTGPGPQGGPKPSQDGVIDLDPDQYAVVNPRGEPDRPPSSATPRIPPRR